MAVRRSLFSATMSGRTNAVTRGTKKGGTLGFILLASSISFVSAFVPPRVPQRFTQACPELSLSTSGNDSAHTVEVSYDGRLCKIEVQSDETILDAMESSGVTDRLAVPFLPSDCRRGNCLTCSGKLQHGSSESSLRRGEDGLSPYISQQVKDAGYVLTCSSYVVGEGIRLELGANDAVWNDIYRHRLEDENAKYAGRKAMARVIRRSAEYNVEKWARETEEVLKRTVD